MDCNSTRLAYKDTGYFSKIIVDYLGKAERLSPFYKHVPDFTGLEAALREREARPIDRALLTSVLKKQYATVETSMLVKNNIDALNDANTFTICTAHQPVIFTGTLYFIYKILHAVKLAEDCRKHFPGKNFVPVYYMGSEDADLEELGKIYMGTEKLTWDTKQKGAVGRMKTKGLEKITDRLAGEISVMPHGEELIDLFRKSYNNAPDIQTATFVLLNELFKEYGVIILIPDSADLKRVMLPVFEDDLFNQQPSKLVEASTERLNELYKVQANPRAINLFYLKDDIRELILSDGDGFEVRNTDIRFTAEEIREELKMHPERFSPNVILRGLFQETILPNIAFIGGGGETAYWLELRDLFEHYQVPFPVLVLRNSFLLIEEKWKKKLDAIEISETEIFAPETELLNRHVRKNTDRQVSLANEIRQMQDQYKHLRQVSADIDPSLLRHVDALQARAIGTLEELEKKLFRAEKRKFSEQQSAIAKVKTALFPLKGLQERIDNFIPWYAKYGKEFFSMIYEHSLGIEQEFVVLTETVTD